MRRERELEEDRVKRAQKQRRREEKRRDQAKEQASKFERQVTARARSRIHPEPSTQ